MTSTTVHLHDPVEIETAYFAHDGKGDSSLHVYLESMNVSIYMSETAARELVSKILDVLPLSKEEQARLDDLELNASLAAAHDPLNEEGVPL